MGDFPRLTLRDFHPAAEKMLPFGAGFESLSLVVGRGEGVDLALGSPVLTTEYGAFSEFGLAKAKLDQARTYS